MMCPFLYFGRIAIVEPVTIGKVSPRNEAIESSQVDYNQHLKSSIGSGILLSVLNILFFTELGHPAVGTVYLPFLVCC